MNRTSLAFSWMKFLRDSTSSPIRRGEDLVGDRGVLDRRPQQRARRRVHRRLLELLPVHLAEALEPVDLDLATLVLGLERAQRGLVLEVVPLLADVGAEQRRLRDVHEALLHELRELPVEEREQQRADVRRRRRRRR